MQKKRSWQRIIAGVVSFAMIMPMLSNQYMFTTYAKDSESVAVEEATPTDASNEELSIEPEVVTPVQDESGNVAIVDVMDKAVSIGDSTRIEF